jgi:hypothetical protein
VCAKSIFYENLLEYFNFPLKTILIFCVFLDYFQIPVKLYFIFKWELCVKSLPIPNFSGPQFFCIFKRHESLSMALLDKKPLCLLCCHSLQSFWDSTHAPTPCASLCNTVPHLSFLPRITTLHPPAPLAFPMGLDCSSESRLLLSPLPHMVTVKGPSVLWTFSAPSKPFQIPDPLISSFLMTPDLFPLLTWHQRNIYRTRLSGLIRKSHMWSLCCFITETLASSSNHAFRANVSHFYAHH